MLRDSFNYSEPAVSVGILIPACGMRVRVTVSSRELGSYRGNEQMSDLFLSLLLVLRDITDILVPGKQEIKKSRKWDSNFSGIRSLDWVGFTS